MAREVSKRDDLERRLQVSTRGGECEDGETRRRQGVEDWVMTGRTEEEWILKWWLRGVGWRW